jgi:hypothetical protein
LTSAKIRNNNSKFKIITLGNKNSA